MIPTCITLDDDQKKLVERLVSETSRIDPVDDYDDVSMASDVMFSVYATGLGDNISVECRGNWINISRDDDGSLVTPLDFQLDEDGILIGDDEE